jgi:drug/metabolite transporter (DMT)-like permease
VLALAEALLVTFLWSTSYVLIKIGLREIDPFVFATYRYVIASFILALLCFYQYKMHPVSLNLKRISVFLLLGFTGYFIAQGLQFLGLYYLPAITVTFILNLTPLFVLFLSVLFLKEIPSAIQLLGIVLTLCGVLTFFTNNVPLTKEVLGITVTFISSIGWAAYMIIVRYCLKDSKENVFVLTTYSMALGSLMLVGATILKGNVAAISLNGWIIILWLSAVNTALAFFLWNHALEALKAYEQSILQNTMLIQITLLAYIFLSEAITPHKILGIIIVFIGVLIVQLRSKPL